MTHNPLHIVVVEDEASLRGDLLEFLSAQGYSAAGAASRAELQECCAQRQPDVVILDINLPDGNGFAIARELRAAHDTGIIMLTCRSGLDDRVSGLDSGADAYLVKHADLREIDATIRTVSRRLRLPSAAPPPPEPLWQYDSVAWQLITPQGSRIRLTAAEAAFMGVLLQHPGAACPRETISAALSRPREENDRSIDSMVKRLKKKVEIEGGLKFPVSVSYGVGYAFRARVIVV